MMDVEAPACRPRRPGFTLLELLVAIGIIGVLLAILIPVLARAHAAQRSASCLMTLRQIGDAFKLYAQDNWHFPED